MSYDLMSDDSLRDEIAKIEAVLRARIVVQHKDKEARRKAQEEAEEKQKLARLKPLIEEYKKLQKLCEKTITLTTSITVPLEIEADVELGPDAAYPEEIESINVTVSAELPENLAPMKDVIETSLEGALTDDLDIEDIFNLFGTSNTIKEIIDLKHKLRDDLDETEYDMYDLESMSNQER